MKSLKKINEINPRFAIPGGEVFIECVGLELAELGEPIVRFNEKEAHLVAASPTRLIVLVPEVSGTVKVTVENEGETIGEVEYEIGNFGTNGLHMVGNPAIDPKDNSVYLTQSGGRGQELENTMYKLDSLGSLEELPLEIKNPTGLVFDNRGKLLVSNRADGEVYQVNHSDEFIPIATDMGVATGLAVNEKGDLFVGDRSGSIYKVDMGALGSSETWAILEPSVSAYHMAFGPDGDLYVTAPGLSSFDCVYRIDEFGVDEIFYKGLGRPQGLAFDVDGNLYVAACLRGRHGVVKIDSKGESADLIIAGYEIVGLCFDRGGNLLIASRDSLYAVPLGKQGVLLSDSNLED